MKLTAILPIHDDKSLASDLPRVLDAFQGTDVHLVGLFIKPTIEQAYVAAPYASASYMIPRAFADEHRAEIKQLADACKREFNGTKLPAGSSSEWREETGVPQDVLPQHALFADIIILPGRNREDGRLDLGYDYDAGLMSHLIVKTPVSVLLLPDQKPKKPVFSAPLLAWKASPESAAAAKALSSMLPPKTAVTLVTAVRNDKADGFGSWSAAQIARYLQRSDLQIEEKVINLHQGSVANALEDYAISTGSSVIVAGGYGRQKWLETLLGGVTRELVEGCRQPVLFAH